MVSSRRSVLRIVPRRIRGVVLVCIIVGIPSISIIIIHRIRDHFRHVVLLEAELVPFQPNSVESPRGRAPGTRSSRLIAGADDDDVNDVNDDALLDDDPPPRKKLRLDFCVRRSATMPCDDGEKDKEHFYTPKAAL